MLRVAPISELLQLQLRITTRRMENDTNDNPNLPLDIYISTGCVILPAFIGAWYYFSKRACRKVVEPWNGSDTIRTSETDFAKMEEIFDAHYQKHIHKQDRDDVDNYSSEELANRFVKWINRQNVFTDYVQQEYELQRHTQNNLCQNDGTAIKTDSPDSTIQKGCIGSNDTTGNLILMTKKKLIDANNSNKVVDQTRLCGDDDRDDSSLFWECIPNPQQSQFNFCSITPTISNDNDEQRDTFHSTSTVSPKGEIKIPHVAGSRTYFIV